MENPPQEGLCSGLSPKQMEPYFSMEKIYTAWIIKNCGIFVQKCRSFSRILYSSLSPRLPVGEIIGEAVREHKLVPKEEYDEYLNKIMDDCGLQTYHKDRYPHEFSGGQRQRICIARALALNPEFVVCDEPVSALDVSVQAQIINLLKELQEKRNLTYLFISHDLSVVQHISDTMALCIWRTGGNRKYRGYFCKAASSVY